MVIVADAGRRPSPRMASVMAEAWAQAGARRQDPLRVRVERRPAQRVAARVAGVPGYGWAAFRPPRSAPAPSGAAGPGWRTPSSGSTSSPTTAPSPSSARTATAWPGSAGWSTTAKRGTPTTTPRRATTSVVRQPDRVELEAIERGPVRATLRMTQHFTWPAGVVDGRRVGQRPVEIVTDIQLHAGEDLVRVAIRFDNPSRDHRLRAWFPLPHRADHTVAECAFATVRRGAAEGGPHEPALATYPARRFVAAGGLTLTHEGLLEYELVDGGAALALTLLRCTGVLSRPAPAGRPNPAGPADRLEAPQLLGRHRVRYAVALGPVNPWRLADAAWLAPRVVDAQRDGPLAGVGQPPGGPGRRGVRPAPPGRGWGHRGAGLQPGRRAGHGGDTGPLGLAGRPPGPAASPLGRAASGCGRGRSPPPAWTRPAWTPKRLDP